VTTQANNLYNAKINTRITEQYCPGAHTEHIYVRTVFPDKKIVYHKINRKAEPKFSCTV